MIYSTKSSIYTARCSVHNEQFAVMLGDDLMEDKIPLTKQLIDRYEDTSKYGVINPTGKVKEGLYDVKSFVEEPAPKDALSNLAIIGRYVFDSKIFDILKDTKLDDSGEVQLTDAINNLNQTDKFYAHVFTGDCFDTGVVKTNIEYGLKRSDMSNFSYNGF